MKKILIIFIALFIPSVCLAEGDLVTRRDGFLQLWESIKRPAYDTRETPFTDVPEGSRGFTEITYAKNRGIIDDSASFSPDVPLKRFDALLWLYRTRNIAELPDMQIENMSEMMERYPVTDLADDLNTPITATELQQLMTKLDTQRNEEVHQVSYYADDFHGLGTAFGETFDMHALTAAHRSFPHNTLVRVTETESGNSVVVRVNDRGPYTPGRSLDLSLAAFEKIAPRSRGVITARLERLGDKDLSRPCHTDLMDRYRKRVGKGVRFDRGIPHQHVAGDPLILSADEYFVVRSITLPSGVTERIEEWVGDGERFTYTPEEAGTYRMKVQTKQGYGRTIDFEAVTCEF